MVSLSSVGRLVACCLILVGAACGSSSNPASDAGLIDDPDAALPPPPDAGWPDPGPAPDLFRARDDLTDDQVATEALKLLGAAAVGGSNRCDNCHGITVPQMNQWGTWSATALAACLTDLDVASQSSAVQMIDCLRDDPSDQSSPYRAQKLGVFSSAAHLDWFEYAFKRAYEWTWETELNAFIDRIGMPKGAGLRYNQAQFDIVATWFARGMPLLDEKLNTKPPIDGCKPGVDPAVASHVSDMALSGWRAVNEQSSLLMFGCAGAATVLDCLDSYPQAGDETFSEGWAVNVPGQVQRILRHNQYRSAFWTRSSADGRFVANGAFSGGASSFVVDLMTDVAIPGNAFYDPAFFPDNSGLVFQGGSAYLCDQSMLVAGPSFINYNTAPECVSSNAIGLYEHVGAALGGGDYWSVDGPFISDNGGSQPTLSDPSAAFSSGSDLDLTPIIHDGSGYQPGTTIEVPTPNEGDAVLSPSAKLVISRVRGSGDSQAGFTMREVIATPSGDGYTIDAPVIGRYCFNGGKPAFSYDERWLVLHHYIGDADAVSLGFTGPADPAFADYKTDGAANVYLIDLLTGGVTRITHMKPGQYAVFPHFRSDGWLYWIVRTAGSGTEYIVASDAALRMETP